MRPFVFWPVFLGLVLTLAACGAPESREQQEEDLAGEETFPMTNTELVARFEAETDRFMEVHSCLIDSMFQNRLELGDEVRTFESEYRNDIYHSGRFIGQIDTDPDTGRVARFSIRFFSKLLTKEDAAELLCYQNGIGMIFAEAEDDRQALYDCMEAFFTQVFEGREEAVRLEDGIVTAAYRGLDVHLTLQYEIEADMVTIAVRP